MIERRLAGQESLLPETIELREIADRAVERIRRRGRLKSEVFGTEDVVTTRHSEVSLLDLAGLKIDIEELLGKNVDVLTYDSLHPLLKDTILDEQVAIL